MPFERRKTSSAARGHQPWAWLHPAPAHPLNRRRHFLAAIALLFLLAIAPAAPAAHSQSNTSSPAYWQYAASGRLDSVTLSDIDRDGVDEILVLDENGRLTLLTAGGEQLWTYVIDKPVGAVVALAVDGPTAPRAVAVAAGDHVDLVSSSGALRWRVTLPGPSTPVAAAAYDHESDGDEDLLVVLASGEMMVYDGEGQLLWGLPGQDNDTANVSPKLLVDDFDRDGDQEIVLGLFTPRRFSQLVYIDDGAVRWRQAISRRISALAAAPFDAGAIGIAVGTNFGQIDLYTPGGERLWFRTLNVPVTALSFAQPPGRPMLVAGTAAGSIVAFSSHGRRIWSNNLARDGDREVLEVLPVDARAATPQPALGVILESASESTDLADILLLGNNGQMLAKLNDTDLPALTRLVDVNKDGNHELLLARFALLQLIGLGIGNSEYIQGWEYTLDAAPSAALVADLDKDGENEIVVGTRNGRLHSLGVDRALLWLHVPGDEVVFLSTARSDPNEPLRVAVVRRQRQEDGVMADGRRLSWLELREASGERRWELVVPFEVTAMVVDDRPTVAQPAIILGGREGQVLAYDMEGAPLWSHTFRDLAGGVRHLVLNDPPGEAPDRLLVAGLHSIYTLTYTGADVSAGNFARLDQPIAALYSMRQPNDRIPAIGVVAFLEDGSVHGLSGRGLETAQRSWPVRLEGPPSAMDVSGEGTLDGLQEDVAAFLVATDRGTLQQLTISDDQAVLRWRLDGLGRIQAVAWDDLDKDGRPDTALIGTRDGELWLYEQLHRDAPRRALEIPLASGVFDLALLRRTSSQSPDLLTITQNGLVRLFREEENRPPLLTAPRVTAEPGQYAIGVEVADVENDPVTVQLEIRDPADGVWQMQAEQELATGNGLLFWPAVSAPDGDQVVYRFRFSDGFYRGYMTPPPGPAAISRNSSGQLMPALVGSFGVLLLSGLFVFSRQSQSPAAQAARFQKRLARQPAEILPLLSHRYAEVSGAPDFLLQLANRARQAGDANLANLADGLFLLPNRTQAGLSIITRTLDDVAASGREWTDLARQRQIYRTCLALLDAPSTTELGLLRPQLVHLIGVLEEQGARSQLFESLLPVLTSLRDSERVDAVEDRLVYLSQAESMLRLVQEQAAESEASIERTLVRAIARRWSGLLSAEIEDQRGRAELEVSLMTKRLAPNGQTHVAMEIRNTGRAPAENIVANLDENPAYQVCSEPQIIPLLPSGRSRQVRFLIEPQAEERFRIGLSLTYDDRNRREKTAAFGDMVHLLPPVREFTPIANPYLPGTALRKGSPLFFGREELFNFITEHMGTQRQRNVLMLVGQRRTGKTSVLLRLEDYLPPHIVPVYIDCQSLGISPGMPALLQEFAWHIADALQARGHQCPVAELSAWQDDPTRLFQREFLPSVRALLGPEAMLLLVFDEFEAFESMVADGILPRTFFPYMRHLMQHSSSLGFIFVGTRRLEEMSADYWSVLFNIALYRKIDFLPPEAAARLICEPVAPFIIYDDLAIDKVLRVTAGHPYFLQLVCYTLVKQANLQKTGYVTISDVNIALDEMLRLGEVHFAYLWQRSTHAERAVLTAAAHLMDRNEPLHPEVFVDYLRSFSVELDPAEVTTALNSLVARDIMREVTEEAKALYELRIGLVGLRVAQNKSLSRLHAYLEQ